jgi:hypothetical protein
VLVLVLVLVLVRLRVLVLVLLMVVVVVLLLSSETSDQASTTSIVDDRKSCPIMFGDRRRSAQLVH